MLARTRQDDCLSDFALDRWLAEGAPPEAGRAAAVEHLGSCARCALRLEEMTASRDAFLNRQPTWAGLHAAHVDAPAEVGSLESTLRGDWPRMALRLGGVLGAVAAVALVIVSLRPRLGGDAREGVRSKGGASIGAYLKRDGAVLRVADGDSVRPGDRLRVVYSSDAPVYFGLLHHDGVSASTYHPLSGEAAESAPGRDVPLDFSIRIDATGRYERLFGVFCAAPVALEPLRVELQQTGRIAAPAGCRVDLLALQKLGEPE